ncbi:MAG: hypothetical protein LBK25_00485 [Treponema sp.]|nr:hypothetical protein [Treponema sp.]
MLFGQWRWCQTPRPLSVGGWRKTPKGSGDRGRDTKAAVNTSVLEIEPPS